MKNLREMSLCDFNLGHLRGGLCVVVLCILSLALLFVETWWVKKITLCEECNTF